ncbi:hypothetical protein HMI55_002242 [Coelomomyces lativittatus]|nr:hypothetical protein HMI55_002242 [Coelomomyces lativittatus]
MNLFYFNSFSHSFPFLTTPPFSFSLSTFKRCISTSLPFKIHFFHYLSRQHLYSTTSKPPLLSTKTSLSPHSLMQHDLFQSITLPSTTCWIQQCTFPHHFLIAPYGIQLQGPILLYQGYVFHWHLHPMPTTPPPSSSSPPTQKHSTSTTSTTVPWPIHFQLASLSLFQHVQPKPGT